MTHHCRTTSGPAQVATTATSIAATPAYTPRRAVFGSLSQCSEKMNSAVATRYAIWIAWIMACPPRGV